MQQQLAAGLAASALLCCSAWAEEAPEQLQKLDQLETVVVIGEPVPRLWKVSKGDHVLWVAGNARLSAGRKWRSDQLDAHVAESQLVLYPGFVSAAPDIGIFKAITLLPAAFKAAKNPDGKTLKDVLPAETYARWRVLKTTYVGRDDDIEKWRPSIAIGMLEDKVLQKLNPGPRPKPVAPGPAVRSLVDSAAKKYKVKIRTMPTVERVVKMDARKILKSAYHVELGDAQCFAQGLDYLEGVIERAKQLAAGPVRVDSSGQEGTMQPRGGSCDDDLVKKLRSGEIPDPAGALKVIDELDLQNKLGREQLDTEWIAAAQAAIAKNRSTFAVVQMNQATSPTGYVAKLKELGYAVEEPN